MLVAVAQMTSGGVIRENLAIAQQLVRRAAMAGAKAVFLPEAADFIAPPASVPTLTRSRDNGAFVSGLCASARDLGVWISVGVHEPPSSTLQEPTRCYNTQLLINDQGSVCAQYRKLHLYDVNVQNGMSILESNTTIPGTELVPPVETPWGRVGLLTCYDLSLIHI